jgi:hypothetical protein
MANAAILLIVTILLIIATCIGFTFEDLDQPLFAINDYKKDDLLVNVKRSMERILLLGDLDDTGSYVDHELSIDDTDLVKATAVGTDVVESCENGCTRNYSVGLLLKYHASIYRRVFCEHDVKRGHHQIRTSGITDIQSTTGSFQYIR